MFAQDYVPLVDIDIVCMDTQLEFFKILDVKGRGEDIPHIFQREFEGKFSKVRSEDGRKEGNGRCGNRRKTTPGDVIVRNVGQTAQDIEHDLHDILCSLQHSHDGEL